MQNWNGPEPRNQRRPAFQLLHSIPTRYALLALFFGLAMACDAVIGPTAGVGQAPGKIPDHADTPPGTSSAGAGTDNPDAPLERGMLDAPHFFRLTQAQYRASVEQLFDGRVKLDGSEWEKGEGIEDVTPQQGFTTIGAARGSVSNVGVEMYESAAYDTAAAALADSPSRADWIGCAPSATTDDGCAGSFLGRIAKHAYRRTLREGELNNLVKLARDGAAAAGDFWGGLQFAVAAVLQSPKFLYRTELGETVANADGLHALTPFELAARLSFALTNSGPDEALLSDAESGQLGNAEIFAGHIERLLQGPGADAIVREFMSQYLDVTRLKRAPAKDQTAYPAWNPETTPQAMSREIELKAVDLFRSGADVRDLVDGSTSFVNGELAALYGLPAVAGSEFAKVDLPAPRRGIFGTGAFLSLQAHTNSSSPTLRGKFLRERLLCQPIPAPPPNVVTQLNTSADAPRTTRAALEEHRKNAACASCHVLMDPPGVTLENFDGIGAFRATEFGIPVDASGDLDGQTITGADELARAVRNNPAFVDCFAKSFYRYVVGRVDASWDVPVLDEIEKRFKSDGNRLPGLMRAVVKSEAFRWTSEVAK